MKKFLIAGSSLAAVAAAGSAGAVDVTLGGSIEMSVEYGLGKNSNNLTLGTATNAVSLSINAAHTTDGGLAFGGGFTMGTAATLEFNPYKTTASGKVNKYLAKATNNDRADILGHAYNVSGGGAVDVADVVSVKINSNWVGIDSEAVKYLYKATPSFTSSAICKVAGRGTVAQNAVYAGSATVKGDAGAWAAVGAAGGYLPAGQLMLGATGPAVAPTLAKSAKNVAFGANALQAAGAVVTSHGATAYVTKNATLAAGKFAVPAQKNSGVADIPYAWQGKAQVNLNSTAGTKDIIKSAAVYAGPFMEVMMASSSTKMVVGALCLDGNDPSETAIHLNNASKVMTVSNASIYIDGGFGRLTLQSSDYAGGVTAIAGAGDQADIDADGIVMIASGLGILGANPYIAVDLAKGSNLGDLEVITGGTIDLGGLSAAIDVALDNPADVFGVSSWDLGLTYAMGDMNLAAAIDSSNDWGLSASMAIAGFGVSTTFGSSSAGDHEKSGITYSVSASTALNGFGLAVGFDQDLQPTVGVNYDLGGLVLSAGYDAGEGGGSIGATLSF
jgi:hypothetical protein